MGGSAETSSALCHGELIGGNPSSRGGSRNFQKGEGGEATPQAGADPGIFKRAKGGAPLSNFFYAPVLH